MKPKAVTSGLGWFWGSSAARRKLQYDHCGYQTNQTYITREPAAILADLQASALVMKNPAGAI